MPRPERPAGLGVAAGLLLLFLGLSAFAVRLSIDNRIEQWLVKSPETALHYQQFRDRFGSDEYVMVMYRGAPLFSAAGLEQQVRALEGLEGLPGVQWVLSLPGVYRDVFGAENPDDFRADALATPFYTGLLLSPEADAAAYLVSFAPNSAPDARAKTVHAIEAAVAPLRGAGYDVHLAGPPLLNVALDEASRSAAARSFPLAVCLSLTVLAFLFRSVWATAVAAGCAALATVATLGLLVLCGRPLTMASSALPTLVWALSLSGVTHIIRRMQIQPDLESRPAAAMTRAITQLARPVTIAACSDAAGFFSLLTASMGPIREVGLFAGVGMLFALVINLFIAPVVLLYGPRLRAAATGASAWTTPLAHGILRWPRAIVAAAALLIAVFCGLLPQLHVESDPLTYMPTNSDTVRDYEAVQHSGFGFYTLETVVNLPTPWTEPAAWPVLEHVQTALAARPGVVRVLSPLDILKKLHQSDANDPAAFALPKDAADTQRLLRLMPKGQRALLDHLIGADGRCVRLSMLIGVMNSGDFGQIVDATHAELAVLPQGYSAYATGIVLQLVDSQLALVQTQLRSFGVAFALIFGVILIGLRSVRHTIAAIPTNLFPVLSAFAFMALARLPLDVATVMMASVALGIAVDDTVHFLAVYHIQRRDGGEDQAQAIISALGIVGPASAITLITAAVGFISLTVANFTPIVWFGIVCAAALMVAMAADLVLTPAVMLLVERAGARGAQE